MTVLRHAPFCVMAATALPHNADGYRNQANHHDRGCNHVGQNPNVRARNVTDRIQENQEENIGKCDRCEGYASQADWVLIQLGGVRIVGTWTVHVLHVRRHSLTSWVGSKGSTRKYHINPLRAQKLRTLFCSCDWKLRRRAPRSAPLNYFVVSTGESSAFSSSSSPSAAACSNATVSRGCSC